MQLANIDTAPPGIRAELDQVRRELGMGNFATALEQRGFHIRSDQCTAEEVAWVSEHTLQSTSGRIFRNAVDGYGVPLEPQFWPPKGPRLEERRPHWRKLDAASQYRITHLTFFGRIADALQEIRRAGASIRLDEEPAFQPLVAGMRQLDTQAVERDGYYLAFRPPLQA